MNASKSDSKTYFIPSDLNEATRHLDEHPQAVVLAGGTDLMVQFDGKYPDQVLDISRLPELKRLSVNEQQICLGAGLSFADVQANPTLASKFPMLMAVAREIGAQQIQNQASLGGNICTSSPVGDSLPVWLVQDAKLKLVSSKAERFLDYEDFLLGYRQVDLQPDELLAEIQITCPQWTHWSFRKVGTRRAQAISKLCMAAAVEMNSSGEMSKARMAMGAVADRPIRLKKVENYLLGKFKLPDANRRSDVKWQEEVIDEVGQLVRSSIQPIDDVRSSAFYRLECAVRLAQNFARELFEL